MNNGTHQQLDTDLQQALLRWYDENRRDLPWRRERDPYRIWVSEIMLQQTRVDTVIPYYERFLARFPDAATLAAAADDDVLTAWAGLGYYRRARQLHAGVREVVARYGGAVPSEPDELARLPGIGPYTAGAIASIAFNRPVPAVDGNVMRVLSRLFRLRDDVRQASARRRFEEVAASLVPVDRPGDFNQALMELGALICIPGRPRCAGCPVQSHCEAYAAGEQTELPVRSRPPAPQEHELACAIIEADGRLFVERRPPDGLLASLWQFPTVELRPGETPAAAVVRRLAAAFGWAVEPSQQSVRHTHTFTHRRWRLVGIGCRLPTADGVEAADIAASSDDAPAHRWVTAAELAALPLAGPHRRIWEQWQARADETAKS